ncbi:MAG: asparagine synthetase B [Candidatus Bathyarchaeota archaeon]|nr:asparagine synthetase B [Candidatus Bathyarchaeum sp.]
MGALVAAVNKNKQNAVPAVATMLEELVHRGNSGHGIATSNVVEKASTLNKLKLNSLESNITLGHNLSLILPRDSLQPVQADGFTFVFEGRMFPAPNLPDLSELKEFKTLLGSNPLKNAAQILEKVGGSYVFVVAAPKKLLVGRDVFGATSLYYGENDSVCAVASERKALWKLGLTNAQSFPPGQLAIVNEHGFSFHPVKGLRMPPQNKLNMETAANALQLLLLESTRKQVSDLESVAVAFSGGVDSSVVATLAQEVGVEVQLISVGLEGQPEVMFTQEAAEALDLPLHLQTYNVNELEETIHKVLWLTEDANVIDACIAVPFYWLAQTASKLGHPVLLAGQGADELFGGYHRYLTEYAKSGAEAVQQKMFYDIQNAYHQNFQRDNQTCSPHGVELRLPFINCDVIDFALRLPLKLKINSTEDKLRKRILRRVAHNLEIPSILADKPKKAVQYTTGVTKALMQLAKDQNLTLREYIEKVYRTVFPA